ncbi:MAG: tyrosine-type recombinase/integrase [Cyclobacteriaceae bacterium]|nr:tyrosine-type recombinase/integrase [Cyclobacteriaceae bacterium]
MVSGSIFIRLKRIFVKSSKDQPFIQELLGHRSSKTTEIYTHVSTKSLQNIKSPFDDL